MEFAESWSSISTAAIAGLGSWHSACVMQVLCDGDTGQMGAEGTQALKVESPRVQVGKSRFLKSRFRVPVQVAPVRHNLLRILTDSGFLGFGTSGSSVTPTSSLDIRLLCQIGDAQYLC